MAIKLSENFRGCFGPRKKISQLEYFNFDFIIIAIQTPYCIAQFELGGGSNIDVAVAIMDEWEKV